MDRGALPRPEADELIARLLGFRYETTWYTENVTKAAARIAEYSPNKPPFSKIVELLKDNGRAPAHVISDGLTCIYEVSQNLEIDASRTAAVMSIINTISKRENGRLLVEQILRAIPAKFGLSAVRAYEAQQVIRDWLLSTRLSGDDQ